MKSMQDNSNLLRLKLDMVYRDLTMEVAQQKFTELTTAAPPKVVVPDAVPAAAPVAPPVKAKRKKLVTTK
jgi:hypothetical protein